MSADGVWNASVKSPIGVQQGTITIATRGGAFTGRMVAAAGSRNMSGTVDGDTLTWTTSLKSPIPITLRFSVTVNGDSMTGRVKAGMFGSFPLVGSRA